MHYLEALENTRNGSTDFWNLIKKITKKKQSLKKTGPIKNEVRTLIFNDTEKADTLNQFFSTIGENLASNQEGNVNPLSYIHRVTSVIGDVDFPVEAFSRKLKSINPKKAHIADNWSAKEIKIAAEEVCNCLTNISKLSFQQGSCLLPSLVEIGKVKALWKSDNKQDCSNYRAVTLL